MEPSLPPPRPGGLDAPRVPPPPSLPAASLPPPSSTPIGGHPTDLAPPPPSPDVPHDVDDVDDVEQRQPPSRAALIALAVLAVAAGLTAWWMFGRDDADSSPPPPSGSVERSAERDDDDSPGASAPDSIGDIGVEALDDARDVADLIDADEATTELLAELGLDALGDPLEDAAAAPPPAGHEFSWTFADGLVATVVVDTTTGDHAYDDNTGLSFRRVGELAFGRASADGPWQLIDDTDLSPIRRIGLERAMTTDDLVTGVVADFVSASGDRSFWSVDEAAFAAADPAGRDEWVGSLGLPIDAPPTEITIWVSTAADGETVSTATVERDSSGNATTYQLTRVFEAPPAIETPDL